ncbi:MAG: hypothetical protein ABIQ35_05025 [Verrucomicrobiota bacterium]
MSAIKLGWEAKFIFRNVTTATPMGSTGHRPVPSGDPPLGIGRSHELYRASVSNGDLLPVPSGQWPDGTGGSPVLPISISEFGLKQSALLHRTVLQHSTLTRFICGALGGIILPVPLLSFSQLLNPHFVSVLAVAAFVLCIVGELLERVLFFTAVVAPKMPGGISP